MMPVFLHRSNDIASRNLDGEMVIMSARNSTLFSLNEVATDIWEAADGKTALEQIVDEVICPRYEVDRETALHDAEELVRELVEQGILTVSESPAE